MLPISMIGVAKSASFAPGPPPTTEYMNGTGGQIYLRGDYKFHYFTASSTFEVTQVGYDPTEGNVIQFLLVGGGGGGGRGANIDTGGGGGGAGEFFTGSYNVSVGTYACVVGAGGIGAPTYNLYSGSNGTSSLITPLASAQGYPLVALGGGYGTGFRYYLGTYPGYQSSSFGGDGGSGGGSTYNSTLDSTTYGGLGVYPISGSNYFWRGNNSGNGIRVTQIPGRPGIDSAITYGGGAGGGAIQAGAGPFNYYKLAGEYYNGGSGNFWELDIFTGSYYAGGGAAGVDGTNLTNVIIAGGIGGGGTAGRGGISNAGSGTPNTGGGGGGAGYWDSITSAGNGGSGIIAVTYRYK
jgi:hypothetical protein